MNTADEAVSTAHKMHNEKTAGQEALNDAYQKGMAAQRDNNTKENNFWVDSKKSIQSGCQIGIVAAVAVSIYLIPCALYALVVKQKS